MGNSSHTTVWECQKCRVCVVVYLEPEESYSKPCSSNYRAGMKKYPLAVMRNGFHVPYVCKGQFKIVLDERPGGLCG